MAIVDSTHNATYQYPLPTLGYILPGDLTQPNVKCNKSQWHVKCYTVYQTYSKNSSAVKKGKVKKVQVTEQLKDVISL